MNQEWTASVVGLADMNAFAISDDGSRIVVSRGVNQRGGVTVLDVAKQVAETQPGSWMPTDQAALVFQGEALVDVARGDSYTLQPDERYTRDRSRSIIRGGSGSGVARSVAAATGQWCIIERYTAAAQQPRWKVEMPPGHSVTGLATAPDGRSIVLSVSVEAGRVTQHIDAIVALDAVTGRELWRQPTELDRTASGGPDVLLFSADGRQLVLRGHRIGGGTMAEIRAGNDGTLAGTVVLDDDAQGGSFDDSLHAAFDGGYLWFFRYQLSQGGGAHTTVFPSGPVGRTTTCAYAVYAVNGQGSKQLARASGPVEVHKLALGGEGDTKDCDVLAILPTRSATLWLLQRVAADRLRLVQRDRPPGA